MTRSTPRPGRYFTLGGRVLALALACAPAARAESSAADKAAAESLFDDGKRLMKLGKFAEACPKLAESQRLDAGVGVLLTLGDCSENNGQLASAWASFREAAAAAKAAGQAPRETLARERAAALEPRLSKLSIVVTSPPNGLEIRRDGQPVAAAVWGTFLAVDPGEHRIEASAPGKKAWSSVVVVSAQSGTASVQVPALADADAPPAGRSGPSDAAPAPAHGDGSAGRTVGLVVGAAGIVGIGVASYFGLTAKSRWSDAVGHCHESTLCDRDGVTLHDQAKSAADVSTVAFVIGGAALATGAILVLSAPSAEKPSAVRVGPSVSPGSAGLVLGGAF